MADGGLSVEELEAFLLQLSDTLARADGVVPSSMAAKLHKYTEQVRLMMALGHHVRRRRHSQALVGTAEHFSVEELEAFCACAN